MHWMRIVLGALLLEVVLFAVLVPLGFVMDNPLALDPAARAPDGTAYFLAVGVGCFVFGYLVARLMLRRVTSRRMLHGALIGALATAMYVGLAAGSPDGLMFVVNAYGPVTFVIVNGLRIAGSMAGAAQKPAGAAVQPAM